MKQNFTIRQGALDGVEAFLAVAGQRNFRKAAAALGVTPSAVSQAIRTLEARIGAALFMRTTRSVGLTEAGERFIARAKPAYEELLAARDAARGLGQRPSGLLRISAPRAAVPVLLEPLIASFCEAYPDVELEIAAQEEFTDLASEGFDAGIRLGQFIAADMVAVRLTLPFPLMVVAAPGYFKRRPPPQSIGDLHDHACLRLRRSDGSLAPWFFLDGNKSFETIVSGPFIAPDYLTLLGAALRGVGLAQLPAPLVRGALADGTLRAVLSSYAVTAPGLFLYLPGKRQVLPKLRAFIEHVRYRSERKPARAASRTAARKSQR